MERKHRLGLAGTAALFGALLYLNSIPNGFVFDDRSIVRDNRQIRSLRNLPEIFRTPYNLYFGDETDAGLYRPVTIASYAANHALGGLRPEGFHLVNVILHALASGLVVLIAFSIPLPASVALAGGLLFAAHPIHTEAVANVVGRAELLAAVFFLSGLLCFARGSTKSAGVFYALALLSKESAIALLGVAVAWEVFLRPHKPGTGLRESVRALSWLVVALLLVLTLRGFVLGSPFAPPSVVPFVDNPLVNHGLVTRWLTATAVAARYVWLLAFPLRLSPDYSWAQIVPVETLKDPIFLSGFVLAAALALLLFRSIRRAPITAFLVFLTILPFSPVSNFVGLIGTIMAERLLYLPSVGACLLAANCWPALRARLAKPVSWTLAIAILGAMSARTVSRNLDWRDEYRLFSKAILTSPRAARVWNNFGSQLLKQGRNEPAKEAILKAHAIAPDWPDVRINLAQVHLAEGAFEEAEAEAREAVRRLPRHPQAILKLGEVLDARGKLQEAVAAYRRGLALDPNDLDARIRLGRAAAQLGDFETAERELSAAVREQPDSVSARTSLGLFYQSRRRMQDALEQLGEAARLLPSSVEVRNNFGNALREAGRLEEAAHELEETLSLDESFAATSFNLGVTLEQLGRVEAARARYLRVLELQPFDERSLLGLARLAMRSGDPEGALRQLDEAMLKNNASKEAYALRARAYFALERYEDAERDLIRLLELDPGSAAARENLERTRRILEGR